MDGKGILEIAEHDVIDGNEDFNYTAEAVIAVRDHVTADIIRKIRNRMTQYPSTFYEFLDELEKGDKG